ncbi:MAG: hypothetical protein EBZ77_00535 [Chitinophagia bacterium]|nr:hypothetical protein [Chitinophagia bacterium]
MQCVAANGTNLWPYIIVVLLIVSGTQFAVDSSMNPRLVSLICLSLFVTGVSCNKIKSSAPELTAAQKQKMVDSIFAEKKNEMLAQSAQDLKYRLKIEVKPVADSLAALQLR